ncbi:MAG: hypothetical protein KDB22_18570 [Planctomycetales bacterium]|nr:hypothetical protein [Planctomycetales bacterium]
MLILFTKDLFFVPSVKTIASQCQLSTLVALSLETVALASVESCNVKVCVVDLSSYSQAGVSEIAAAISSRFPTAKTVGYGPHVQVQKLENARVAGFDAVLTRGQLTNKLAELLDQWLQS